MTSPGRGLTPKGKDLAMFSTLLTDLQIEVAMLHQGLVRSGNLEFRDVSVTYDGSGAGTNLAFSWRTSQGDLVNVSISKRGYFTC